MSNNLVDKYMEEKLLSSGVKAEYITGAVRDSDEHKGFPHMIPPIVIRELAKHFQLGCLSYGKYNYLKGLPLSRLLDSTFRHILQWSEGKKDEKHLVSALWNLSVALWTEDQIEKGNLPKELHDLPYYGQGD